MHNVKRRPKGEAEPPAVVKRRQAKVQAYSKLSRLILQLRKAGDYGSKALKLTAKMAMVNPDFYSLWNYRREIIMHKLSNVDQQDAGAKQELLENMCREELVLTADALQKRNPKCYYAWHQRKWIVCFDCVDLSQELTLCDEFLARDERNCKSDFPLMIFFSLLLVPTMCLDLTPVVTHVLYHTHRSSLLVLSPMHRSQDEQNVRARAAVYRCFGSA